MSHFTVLVLGDKPEDQLAPYHEFECTGCNDQYVQDLDITEDVRNQMKEDHGSLEDALAYYGLEDKIVESEAEVVTGTLDEDGPHKYGYAIVKDDKLIKAVNRTNPNAKWDWYQMGGRWTGFYKVKPNGMGLTGRPGLMTPEAQEGYADQIMLGDVDIAFMRDDAEAKARAKYRLVASVFGGTIPRLEKTWKETLADESMGDTDKKREFYHAQKPLVTLKKALKDDEKLREELGWFFDLEDFSCTEDEYAQQARDAALVPFAFVKDGKWYERGEMGFWAFVSNEKDKDVWNHEFNHMLDELPANTLLTMVDCHI